MTYSRTLEDGTVERSIPFKDQPGRDLTMVARPGHIGVGGFQMGWLDSDEDGIEVHLTAGAGTGSSKMMLSVKMDGEYRIEAVDMAEVAEAWSQAIIDDIRAGRPDPLVMRTIPEEELDAERREALAKADAIRERHKAEDRPPAYPEPDVNDRWATDAARARDEGLAKIHAEAVADAAGLDVAERLGLDNEEPNDEVLAAYESDFDLDFEHERGEDPGPMTEAEAMDHIRHLMIGLQKARSNAMEAAGDNEQVAALLSPWLIGPKSVLPAVASIVDAGTVTGADFYNIAWIVDHEPQLRAVVGAVLVGRDWPDFPAPSFSWQTGWADPEEPSDG